MARPTKLTPELSEEICEALREGAYIETAAQAAGIDDSTLYRWLDRGADGEEPFAAFCEAVMRARAEGELELFREVKRGDGKGEGFGTARAAAFILERTRPNKYAQRINLKVEEAVGKVLEVVRGVCSQEDFARVLERLERVDSEGSAGDAPGDGAGEDPSPVH